MTRKNLSLIAFACLGVLGMVGSASACQFTQWGQGSPPGGGTTSSGAGMLVASQPDGQNGTTPGNNVARYSGKCGSLSKAPGNMVRDGLPGSETAYHARFYAFTGVTGGTARIFRAVSSTAQDAILVDYNATSGSFVFTTLGGNQSATGIVANRWYAIELFWSNGGQMTVSVQGNGSKTPITVPNVAAGSSNIDYVELGWISGAATASPGIVTDAFESRRATNIGRLPRGDANNNGSLSFGDASAIVNEVLNGALNLGQPDCNENGGLSFGDASCVVDLVLNGGT